MKLKNLLFVLVLLSIISCTNDNLTDSSGSEGLVDYKEEGLTDLLLEEDLENRLPACVGDPTLDGEGCCVYTFVIRKNQWYEIDGNFFAGGKFKLCEGETASLKIFKRKNGKVELLCSNILTCTCCEQFEFSYNLEYQDEYDEHPGCCELSFEYNNPPCSANLLVLRGITPKLGPNANVVSYSVARQSMVICGNLSGTEVQFIAGIPSLDCIKRSEWIELNGCY